MVTPDGELKTPGVKMEEAKVGKSLYHIFPFHVQPEKGIVSLAIKVKAAVNNVFHSFQIKNSGLSLKCIDLFHCHHNCHNLCTISSMSWHFNSNSVADHKHCCVSFS